MNLKKLNSEYNFNFDINYKDLINEDKQDSEFEKQFLKVFYLENYHDSISTVIEKIYNEVKENILFKQWLIKMNSNNNMLCPKDCNIDLMNFMLLFTFDCLQLTHNCLKSLYNNDKIDDKCLIEMNNYFNK